MRQRQDARSPADCGDGRFRTGRQLTPLSSRPIELGRALASTQPDICDSLAMADTETCRHCGEARHTPEDSCLTIAQRAGPMMGWLILAVVAAFILLIVVVVLG
jgi:hypothetical protein